jgi:hypothetical protein
MVEVDENAVPTIIEASPDTLFKIELETVHTSQVCYAKGTPEDVVVYHRGHRVLWTTVGQGISLFFEMLVDDVKE